MTPLSRSFKSARMCGLVGSLCALLVLGGWNAAGAPATDAPPVPVRLAVLATDTGTAQ